MPRLDRVEVLIFAGNHGVTAQGVSPYPASVTRQMVANFERGGAAINQIARVAGAALRIFPLVLDHPTRNPTADQSDEQTEQDLKDKLSTALSFAWAPVRSSPEVHEWIFPTAYHIKVAVRDSMEFWLSSGNWNNSNQPEDAPAVPFDQRSKRLVVALAGTGQDGCRLGRVHLIHLDGV